MGNVISIHWLVPIKLHGGQKTREGNPIVFKPEDVGL
jgi:hypothetical protein